jgi:hypothetical protein
MLAEKLTSAAKTSEARLSPLAEKLTSAAKTSEARPSLLAEKLHSLKGHSFSCAMKAAE